MVSRAPEINNEVTKRNNELKERGDVKDVTSSVLKVSWILKNKINLSAIKVWQLLQMPYDNKAITVQAIRIDEKIYILRPFEIIEAYKKKKDLSL